MDLHKLVPVGALGQRIRKAFVAGSLLAGAWWLWLMVRDPVWDGWWDAFNWPQLFLYAPILFLFLAAVWQLVCFVAEWLYRKARRESVRGELPTSLDIQRSWKFWRRECVRICVLFITTCAVGDIPMAVSYLSNVRRWRLQWGWHSALDACLPLMIAAWWILQRIESYSSGQRVNQES